MMQLLILRYSPSIKFEGMLLDLNAYCPHKAGAATAAARSHALLTWQLLPSWIIFPNVKTVRVLSINITK